MWREAAFAAEQLRAGVLLFVEDKARQRDTGRAEAELSRALRSLGLNTVKLPPSSKDASYAALKKMSAWALRQRLAGKANCLVLARLETKHIASEQLVKLIMHFYQARGEAVVLDLDEGRVVASAGFDWSPGTHTGEEDAARAAEGALLKAAKELGLLLSEELAAGLNLSH